MRERLHRLGMHAAIWLPLASGIAWCAFGHWLPGAGGIAVGLANLGVQLRRRRHPILWPAFGDPNRRRPIVINRLRWPRG